MTFDFSKLSVLVAEDTVPMRKLVCSVLETLGVGTIYTAGDGDGAFEVFCKQQPDIIITDWHMVPVTGLDLIRKVRQSDRSPNRTAPVIMMTGYSAMPRVAEARDMGCTEFLVKPFSAADLAKRIAYVINKPRDFVETERFFGPDRRRRADEGYSGPRRRNEDGG
jgi:two-component system chemotaxis response regulator CheY